MLEPVLCSDGVKNWLYGLLCRVVSGMHTCSQSTTCFMRWYVTQYTSTNIQVTNKIYYFDDLLHLPPLPSQMCTEAYRQ